MNAFTKPDDFGVVVLNFNDYESSIACVRSWLRCDPLPPVIALVDNCSPNESLVRLQEAFADEERVVVLDSGRNGGYSFSNNVGIRFVRERGCRHAVISTSDTIVESEHILRRLAEETTARTGMIAPQITSTLGHENPSVGPLDLRAILDFAWLRRGMPLRDVRRQLSIWLRRVRNKPLTGKYTGGSATDVSVHKVFKLHGAFLCITEAYIERVGLMEEDMFMYCEEDMFAYQCVANGLDQVLVPDVTVHHEHESSVAITHGDQVSDFVRKHQKTSCQVLLRDTRLGPLVRAWLRGPSG